TIVLKEEHEKDGTAEGEKPRATIFFVAYTRDDAVAYERPITFAFNGGPGSSSVWLPLGLLGPQRVQFDDEGWPLPPPYRLIENDYSLLDVSDLVFIDPVSTGYSRVVPGEKPTEFHGFKKDIESVGDFIRLYTTRYRRWGSPKYLAGESYGTTRAAGLAGYLQERHGMYLNGIMLISVVLNFQTLEFEHGNDLPYVFFLPTYCATAWYHRRLAEDLQHDLRTTLHEVERFAYDRYLPALMRGSALDSHERAAIVAALARYTGLSAEYIEHSNLRIRDDRFVKQLLRSEQQTVGRLDSRFTGSDRDAAGERSDYDPSYAAILGPYTATLHDYLSGALGYHSDLPYEVLSGRVHPWSYAEHQNRYVDVGETLRQALALNPALRIYVASGYFDLATPHFATDYTLNQLAISAEQRRNVQVAYYEAGHMMYAHLPSLVRLKADLAQFVR
ncbi:MAG TPA: peptidase S10, partial [Roseiflexaceae bacterium]|nr:peptidase S10 [Roseiflexaceae bacterium]